MSSSRIVLTIRPYATNGMISTVDDHDSIANARQTGRLVKPSISTCAVDGAPFIFEASRKRIQNTCARSGFKTPARARSHLRGKKLVCTSFSVHLGYASAV